MSTQGERLRQGIELAGFTKVAPFAESVNEKAITVRQHINRGRIPMRVVEKYVRALRSVGVTTEWLLYGKGPAPKGSEGSPSPSSPAPPLTAALASAPPGSLVQNPKGRPATIASHHVVWDRFVKFARKEGLTLGRIAQAAGLPPSAASEPTGPYSEQVETLKKLAKAATKLLKRPVPLDDLLVEQHAGEVPVRSYVGAGDEIIPFDDEEPLYWTAPPPELEGECEATQVRGTSMLPAYEDGDVLFHRRHDDDPTRFLGRVVILQTRSRKRYVKVLQAGTKKGHFDLVSFNRLSPTIENQQLLWVAPILWVKKRQTV